MLTCEQMFFRKDEPFVCMVQFLPSAESADMILVGTAEFVAIYVVVLFMSP